MSTLSVRSNKNGVVKVSFFRFSAVAVSFVLFCGSAVAELSIIKDQDTFVNAVENKVLQRPFIKLRVEKDGRITGKALTMTVSGEWIWKDGYFCRDLSWGSRDLGYNCQQVALEASTIRFTSDQGTGDFADFTLK